MLLAIIATGWCPTWAAEGGETQSAGGLTVYLGIVPAEIFKRPDPHTTRPLVHGGAPRGPHEHHIVIAIYDSRSGELITNATVTAKISGIGLSASQKLLEPMKIADTLTYGGFFNLTADLYTIVIIAQRPGLEPVTVSFKYDHRHR